MSITFMVYGEPQPKGSARAFVRNVGGKARAIVTSANPSLAKWEQLVRYEAQTAMRRAGLDACPFFDGSVAVRLRFGLIRPASVSAKRRPHPTVKPDLDKLTRAAIDPLSGVLFRDDAQVIDVSATKHYVPSGPAFTEITILEA